MIARTGHAVYFALALTVMVVPLVCKGHGSSPLENSSVVFVRSEKRSVSVMMSGVPEHSGVYQVNPGSTCLSVINMALSRCPVKYIPPEAAEHVLHNGDFVSVRKGRKQTYEVSVGTMTVTQLMLLGIPLDVNRMGEKDWELLPGVGPELAKQIVCYRQYNGDFSSIRDLEWVPGIGPRILSKIQEYF